MAKTVRLLTSFSGPSGYRLFSGETASLDDELADRLVEAGHATEELGADQDQSDAIAALQASVASLEGRVEALENPTP